MCLLQKRYIYYSQCSQASFILEYNALLLLFFVNIMPIFAQSVERLTSSSVSLLMLSATDFNINEAVAASFNYINEVPVFCQLFIGSRKSQL